MIVDRIISAVIAGALVALIAALAVFITALNPVGVVADVGLIVFLAWGVFLVLDLGWRQ